MKNPASTNSKQVAGNGKTAAGDDKVGYRSPPRRHQFKKGQSGNRRGRSKGSRNLLTVFKQVVMEKVKVRIAGEVRKMTMAEYVLRANYMAALKRNQKALGNILMLAQVAGHLVDQDDLKRMGVPIAQSQSLTTDEFETLFGNALPSAKAGKHGGKDAKN